MKPGKFFVVSLLAIWEVDPTQKLEKYEKWLYVLIRLTNRNMK